MAKKISNEIERETPLEDVAEPPVTPDIISAVEPVKKRRQLTDEQREKQRLTWKKEDWLYKQNVMRPSRNELRCYTTLL